MADDSNGDDLDKQYGAAAGDSDLDPTHLRALAFRIQQLAGQIDLQRAEGRRRDDRIKGVQDGVTEANRRIEALDQHVDVLVRQQFDEEDRKTLVALMKSYTFKDQAWKVGIRYAGYASAVAAFVYMLREPLTKFLHALGGGP